jgi:hypothetical protein
MDFFPKDPDIRTLLVERLHKLAADHQHAKSMIDHWLENQTAAPKVSDLVGLASLVKNKSNTSAYPSGCERCATPQGGGGFGHQLTWEPFVEARNGSGFVRCSCPRGRALLAADRQHAA